MNKIERVRAAVAGQEVDRVPAGFWFHFPEEQKHGAASVKAHLDYYRAAGVDLLKVMNEHPYQTSVSISSPSDWRYLRPTPLSAPFFQQQLDELKRIVDGVQGETLVISTVFGPYSEGNQLSGGKLTEHMNADPEAVSQGLETIAESLARFSVACIDAGAAGVYYSAQGGEAERFSEDVFQRYIKPHDLSVLQTLQGHGEFNLLHVCGDNIRLPLFANYPSHAVNWAATKHNLNLKQGYSLFKRTVVGGMGDRGIIVNGSREEIQHAVHEVIDDFGTRSFILGADCTVPTDIDLAHIRAAVEATAI